MTSDIFGPTSENKPTCLFDEPHDLQHTKDLRAHYFGCLEAGDRAAFLSHENPLWARLVEEEKRNLPRRGTVDGSGRMPEANAARQQYGFDTGEVPVASPSSDVRLEGNELKRFEAALALESEFKRIECLRKAIFENDPARLVQNLSRSGAKWRHMAWLLNEADEAKRVWKENNRRARKDRPRIAAERSMTGPSSRASPMLHQTGTGQSSRAPPQTHPSLQPPVSSQATKLEEPPTEQCSTEETTDGLPGARAAVQEIIGKYSQKKMPESGDPKNSTAYNLLRDVKAQVIKFQKRTDPRESPRLIRHNESVCDEVYRGQFLDQHLSMENLLNGRFKKLEKLGKLRRSPVALQYIHIPYNNMEVRGTQCQTTRSEHSC